MNRRKFVLSWGRKLFFGLSWPLTSMLAMVYLRAFILPTSTVDWFYFVLMFFGYFGMVNAIVYFAAYCPIVLLMPSYYVSRIWSLLLIIALNLFILLDALSFANYNYHLYSFLSKLFIEKGLSYLIGSEVGLIITCVGFFILAVLIWLRGEMIWRSMQGRFSNPVKNWYLVLIVLAVLVAKLTYHYGEVHPKLSEVFPLDQNFTRKEVNSHNDNRKFFYPTDSLNCQNKSSPNIILIVIREWSSSQTTPETTPILAHLKKHFISYNNHQNVSFNGDDGLFSLMYSIPASYKSSIGETSPAIANELKTRNYETLVFDRADDEQSTQEFRNWIANRTGEEIRPYFLQMNFKSHASEVDKYVGEVILTLEKEKILSQTHVVVTGAYSGNESETIPLFYAYPDRRTADIETPTSVYDVMPTLMQRTWGCKKVFKVASVGHPLDFGDRDWLLVTGKDDFKIVDYANKNVTTVQNGVISDTNSQPRHQLIFSAMKMKTSFSKSR
jgi:membrane-anchored protein YejM (alkaline phosphatase superfamily)